MDFEVYRVVFCVVVGIVGGSIWFVGRACTVGCVGLSAAAMEKNEDGSLKVFNFWNLGVASFIKTGFLVWYSGVEGSFVEGLIIDSYAYFMGAGAFA